MCLRFATAIGLSPRLRLDLLVNDFVYQALVNRTLIVYEKHYRRSFINVADLAGGIVFTLEHADQMIGEIHNVGSDAMNYTKEEIALAIRERIQLFLHFAEVGEDLDKRDYHVPYDKIRALGFDTRVSMEQTIDELIRGITLVTVRNPYTNV